QEQQGRQRLILSRSTDLSIRRQRRKKSSDLDRAEGSRITPSGTDDEASHPTTIGLDGTRAGVPDEEALLHCGKHGLRRGHLRGRLRTRLSHEAPPANSVPSNTRCISHKNYAASP